MLIGVAAVVLGGFIIICAAPFASHRLYKAGGSLFLTSGETLTFLNPSSFMLFALYIYLTVLLLSLLHCITLPLKLGPP